MHAFEPDHLSDEQRAWAARANALHHRLQGLLLDIAVSDRPLLSTLKAEPNLGALAHQLLFANLELWKASETTARRAIDCSRQVRLQLGSALTPASFAAVTANARAVQNALTALTDAQRTALLALPEVSLAFNVAMDCEAEFENPQQWRRWLAKAYPNRKAAHGFAVANDNGAEEGVQPVR